MSHCYVYLHLPENAVPVGLLTMEGEGRAAVARFSYGRRYLQRKDAFPVDPVQLPLGEQEYLAPEGFALFNGIRDAAPDGWGRHLLDCAAGARVLTEFDYLVATGEDRVGALAFGPDLSGPTRIVPWDASASASPSDPLAGKQLDLAALLDAIREFDSAEELPAAHRRFLVRGSSLGGARPKAAVDDGRQQWIAKFTRAEDRYPVCRAEHAAMKLASRVGLCVPKVRLERVMDHDIYLVERFDREGKKRIPFISGLTLIGARESESSQQSYRALAEQLRRFGSRPRDDAKELWLRMIFNILCNNTDDHLRNHGFLWDGTGWRLSPAYDVVPFPQVGRERYLAIGVGKEGRQATIANALSQAESFGLSVEEAAPLAITMRNKMKREWEKVFRSSGMVTADIERLRSCFLACEEAIKLPIQT